MKSKIYLVSVLSEYDMDTNVSDVGVYSSIENAEKAQKHYQDMVNENESIKETDFDKYRTAKVDIHGNTVYLFEIISVGIAEYILDDFSVLQSLPNDATTD